MMVDLSGEAYEATKVLCQKNEHKKEKGGKESKKMCLNFLLGWFLFLKF